MGAEFHFQGQGQPLTGGREFFESLVRAVSSYAQEFLSGVSSPRNQNGQAALVHLRKIHGDLHRLTFEENSSSTAPETEAKMPLGRNIDLTTVQLFDLVEAVDQFFADPLTLPDLSLNLRPVSKRELISTEPIAKLALPAGIGVSGFALAAIAFFFLPIPEVRRPTEPGQETEGEGRESVEDSLFSGDLEEPMVEPSPESVALPTGKFSDSDVAVAEGQKTAVLSAPGSLSSGDHAGEILEVSPAAAPKITDFEKVERLRAELFARIDNAWTEVISSNLMYRVEVTEDGAMVGYKPINPEAADFVARTPLPEMLYKGAPAGGGKEPVAEFKVEFISNGTLQVNPW
jgi:hypothetical protein